MLIETRFAATIDIALFATDNYLTVTRDREYNGYTMDSLNVLLTRVSLFRA